MILYADITLRAVAITLSIVSLLLIILVLILLKRKRCRRVRKLPMAENLGSSEVLYLRPTSKNPYSETKFE